MVEGRQKGGRSVGGTVARTAADPNLTSGWRRHDRETVAALALALVEDISLDGAIQRILDEVRSAMGADALIILLARPDGATLEVAGARLRTASLASVPEVQANDSCFCARAFRVGRPEVVERLDPSTDGRLATMLHDVEGLRSMMSAPLRAQRGVIGTLTVGYARERRFSPRDRELIGTLADIAAAGIQNARLYEATLRRERHGEIISQVLAALTATIDADQVPRRLVEVLLHAYGADRAWLLYPCDPSAPSVSIPYESTTLGYPGAHALGQPLETGALNYAITKALASDGPFAIDIADPAIPADFRALHIGYDVQSLLAVKFQPRNDRPWLVGLHQCSFRRAWTPEETSILAEIAGYATVAIEHAQLFQRAQQALRIRDEFISSAAHELKTPVTAMKGYAQALMRLADRQGTLDARFHRALLAIDHNADRITRLTHDLLEVATLDTYGREMSRSRIDLGDLVCSAVADIEVRAGDRTVDCRIVRPAIVDGHRDRLADAIQSLMDNAIRYSPDGSRVEVEVDVVDGEAIVSVHDAGPGIPEERWPYLFEPLYEPHPAGGQGYVGVVSLGLYLARRIVEEHDGRIWFETKQGSGTTFHIAIPRAEPGLGDGDSAGKLDADFTA